MYDKNECRLCVEIDNFKESLFAKKYPTILSKNTFFESSQLQLMIPVGPFCEGHLLIATKSHEWSFGHLGKEIIPELTKLIEDVSNFLKVRYNKKRIIIYEHGPVSRIKLGGCCLAHAHMNIMPIPESIPILELALRHLNFVPTKFDQLKDFIEREEPYLFFQCPREGSFAVEAPIGTTQFFRKLLASTNHGGSWDWRKNLNINTVKSMVALLEYLPKPKDSFS